MGQDITININYVDSERVEKVLKVPIKKLRYITFRDIIYANAEIYNKESKGDAFFDLFDNHKLMFAYIYCQLEKKTDFNEYEIKKHLEKLDYEIIGLLTILGVDWFRWFKRKRKENKEKRLKFGTTMQVMNLKEILKDNKNSTSQALYCYAAASVKENPTTDNINDEYVKLLSLNYIENKDEVFFFYKRVKEYFKKNRH